MGFIAKEICFSFYKLVIRKTRTTDPVKWLVEFERERIYKEKLMLHYLSDGRTFKQSLTNRERINAIPVSR